MSSWTGLKRADGQRLSPSLAALCGTFTPTLNLAARHPNAATRTLLDHSFSLVGFTARNDATARDLDVGGLPARLYEPADAGSGLLVYFHGGGFVFGGLRSHANTCRFTAREARCRVLAVQYRKAPEHQLPAAFDDARATFRWAVEHATELGVDPAKVAVGGDSAGGQLAAAVALHTDGGPKPAFAFLIYPVLDADIASYESASQFARGPALSRGNALDMIGHYVPRRDQVLDPRMRVIDAEPDGDPTPMFVATAGMDPLRDQGESFAERLRGAGATVELERFSNLPHGFNLMLIQPQARAAYAACCARLAIALA